MALPAQTGNRFQKLFKQTGLAITVQLRFLYPLVAVRQLGPFCRLPEIEIGNKGTVGELVLDALAEELQGVFGKSRMTCVIAGPDRQSQRLPEPLPDISGRAFADGCFTVKTHVHIAQMPLLYLGSGFFHG